MISSHVKNIVFLHVYKNTIFFQWQKTLYHTNVYETNVCLAVLMLYVFENIYLASPLWFSHALAKLLKAFLSNASLSYATYVVAPTPTR